MTPAIKHYNFYLLICTKHMCLYTHKNLLLIHVFNLLAIPGTGGLLYKKTWFVTTEHKKSWQNHAIESSELYVILDSLYFLQGSEKKVSAQAYGFKSKLKILGLYIIKHYRKLDYQFNVISLYWTNSKHMIWWAELYWIWINI